MDANIKNGGDVSTPSKKHAIEKSPYWPSPKVRSLSRHTILLLTSTWHPKPSTVPLPLPYRFLHASLLPLHNFQGNPSAPFFLLLPHTHLTHLQPFSMIFPAPLWFVLLALPTSPCPFHLAHIISLAFHFVSSSILSAQVRNLQSYLPHLARLHLACLHHVHVHLTARCTLSNKHLPLTSRYVASRHVAPCPHPTSHWLTTLAEAQGRAAGKS